MIIDYTAVDMGFFFEGVDMGFGLVFALVVNAWSCYVVSGPCFAFY